MPTWVTVVVAGATPVLAFVGVLLGQRVSRRNAMELERWRRREETMRLLRWAVESASSDNAALSITGLTALHELLGSELLQPEDEPLVAAVAASAYDISARITYGDLPPETYTEREISVQGEEAVGDGRDDAS